MSSKKSTAKLLLRNAKGVFVETGIPDEPANDGAGYACPETGKDLAGYNLKKYAQSLWPTLTAHNLPNTEAGLRYQIILDEAARRESADLVN